MNLIRVGWVLLIIITGLQKTVVAEPASKGELLLSQKRPLVIAHRGFSSMAPENTLPSFKLAMAAGADLVELDYHHDKDGKLVVIHDYTLDRTTDAIKRWGGKSHPISKRSSSEWSKLDAGRWFGEQYDGVHLSTLDDALDVIQSGNVTLIERKAGEASACVELIRRRGLLNQVVVQAFDWDYLRDYHRLEPRQILGALGPASSRNGRRLTDSEKALSEAWIQEVIETGARIVVWNKQVSRETVALAHARGLRVWVYTINDPAVANELLDLGVDGIITDNAAQMWRTIALRALK